MKTNKNIDRLFQEKLKDFEVSPPDNVWVGIEKNLKITKPKLLLPLWLRIGSVAAILMLLTLGSINYFISEPTNTNDDNIILTDSDIESTPKINEEILKEDILNSTENETTITSIENNDKKDVVLSKETPSNKELQNNNQKKSIQNTITVVKSKNNLDESNAEIATNNNSSKQNTSFLNIDNNKDQLSSNTMKTTQNKAVASSENIAFKNNLANNRDNSTSSQSNKMAENITKESVVENLSELEDKSLNTQIDSNEDENTVALIEDEKIELLEDILNESIEEEKEVEENSKKWSVASIIGPVFYNSFTEDTSPLDPQFVRSPKKGSKSTSYGVNIEYKLNKKLSLRSGVALVNVGYEIRDVYINPSQQLPQKLTNVDYNNNVVILSINATQFLNNSQLETLTATPTKGILNQEFGYIEVPLELKYKLNNSKKIGLNLIGGFSTLFLNKNEVYVETSVFSSNIGKANNLNNVNFSGNLGIDLDYKVNKNLYFNVAPILKIHTSTFSKNADNFKPYMFGVYTGLNYKF